VAKGAVGFIPAFTRGLHCSIGQRRRKRRSEGMRGQVAGANARPLGRISIKNRGGGGGRPDADGRPAGVLEYASLACSLGIKATTHLKQVWRRSRRGEGRGVSRQRSNRAAKGRPGEGAKGERIGR